MNPALAAALQVKLFDYQIVGRDWMLNQPHGRAYLGDAPGLGKTLTAASALAALRPTHPLVVCPAIVRGHWRRTLLEAGVENARVISYGDDIGSMPDALVLDEAHYMKSVGAQRTLRLLGANGPARYARHVFPLSGSPVPRTPEDFGTILMSCFPYVARQYRIGTLQEFRNRFVDYVRVQVRRGEWRNKPVGIKREEEFREILAACMLRRTADQVGVDVPELFWQVMPLTVETAKAALMKEAWPNNTPENQLKAVVQEKEYAEYRHAVGDLKAAAVANMLVSQLQDSNEKVVVFAFHHSVLNHLESIDSAGIPVFRVDGETPDARRFTMIEQFQMRRGPAVFLAQNGAAGTGTDGLQHAASRCILVEPEFPAYLNDQMAKRLARIGGGKRVIAQMVCLEGTLDEQIIRHNHREVEWHNRMFTTGAAE